MSESTTEIERKFVLHPMAGGLVFDSDASRHMYTQYYLTHDPVETRLVRLLDRSWELTIKSKGDLSRTEVAMTVTPGQADALVPLAATWITKSRFYFDRWEVDVFAGHLTGLVVAECELVDVDEQLPSLPVVLEAIRRYEVTYDSAFKNANLAKRTPLQQRAFVKRANNPRNW